MSSSRALFCLSSMKKQKHDFHFFRSASADNPYLDLAYTGYHKKPHPIIVYKQKTSPQSYQTESKILANPGLT